MPTTECSHCGERIDVVPLQESDTMFDWRCPNCGQPVVLDGSAKEQRRQRQARERFSEQIQDLAAELDTPSYEPSPYSVTELKEELETLLEEIDDELDRR